MVAVVQSTSVDGSSTLAFTGAVTAGNALMATFRVGATGITGVSLSDNINGSWGSNFVTADEGVNTLVTGWFNGTASGTPTVTASWTGGGTIRMAILEISGQKDQINSSNQGLVTTTTPTTGSITTTSATELLVASLETNNGETVTLNSTGSNPTTFSNLINVATGKLYVDTASVTSTGSYNETWTASSSDAYGGSIISFKALGGGAGRASNLLLMGIG